MTGDVLVELEGTIVGILFELEEAEGRGYLGLESLSWARRSWRRSFSSLSSRKVFSLFCGSVLVLGTMRSTPPGMTLTWQCSD